MMRGALVLVVVLCACPPSGSTCGRGRCQTGACIQAIQSYTVDEQLSPDWWCAVPCPGTLHCGQELCLQSPMKSSLLICSGDQLEVKYTIDPGAELDFRGVSVALKRDFDISGAHVDGGSVHCSAGQVCSAGWFRSGEFLPTVTVTLANGESTDVINGTPGEGYPLSGDADLDAGFLEPLGPLLPTGLDIVVHLGNPLPPRSR